MPHAFKAISGIPPVNTADLTGPGAFDLDFAIAFHYRRIGFVDLDETFEVLDPEVGKGGRALVVDAVDSEPAVFRVHFESDVGQPVFILAEHLRDTGNREDGTGRRRVQAASRRWAGLPGPWKQLIEFLGCVAGLADKPDDAVLGLVGSSRCLASSQGSPPGRWSSSL
jgi:hypothetical protein